MWWIHTTPNPVRYVFFESVHFLFNMSSIARKKKLRTYQVASYKNELIELLNFCGGQSVVLRRRKYMFAN